jgi:hypothetical protein
MLEGSGRGFAALLEFGEVVNGSGDVGVLGPQHSAAQKISTDTPGAPATP